jgi:UDP-2,3-diacylglucosamine hydrolase
VNTLFISDLHLSPERPEITALFLAFLRRQARSAEALYILGDLFEVWIGDDDTSPLANQVATALRALRDAGTRVLFIHGNRDFLLGRRYAERAGLELLPETRVIDLHGEPTLILHGDTLCTDDVDYQSFRVRVRNPRWQRRMLRLPLFLRRFQARRMRRASQRSTRTKPTHITDVNPGAVTAALREHGVRRMIHGHTHRPAIHEFELDGQTARRIVLGDWYHQGSMLQCDAAGCRLIDLPLENH